MRVCQPRVAFVRKIDRRVCVSEIARVKTWDGDGKQLLTWQLGFFTQYDNAFFLYTCVLSSPGGGGGETHCGCSKA